MADVMHWLDEALADLERRSLRRHLTIRSGPCCPSDIILDATRYVNFGSNDYLGLAAELLTEAVQASLLGDGWGSGASPLCHWSYGPTRSP